MGEAIKLLLFSRYPTAGQVKSRLAAGVGPGAAARWQRRLTEETVATARRFRQNWTADRTAKPPQLVICHTGASSRRFRAWLGSDLVYQDQGAGDLGCRLWRAIKRAGQPSLASRLNGKPQAPKILVIGADAPQLTPEHLAAAGRALEQHELVLGPAVDGGYYLLGLNKPHPRLFQDIAWGTARVYEQTLAAARRLGLSCATLPTLTDIDRPPDLATLHDDPRFADLVDDHPTLSLIIPTYNEATRLEATIAACRQQATRPEQLEIIVVDGGSRDQTPTLARRAGAAVFSTPPGRAGQQNLGAEQARGRQLLFLHADSHPPVGFDEQIAQTLSDPAIQAGAFSLTIDAAGLSLRLLERGTNLRSRLLGLPYGDQGIFIEKKRFLELGGFPPLSLMEDFELSRRLRRRGRLVTLPTAVTTSARRWQKLGPWRTFLLNQLLVAAFLLGIDPARLAALYHRPTGRQ
ncbi:MAG: TIGR04283 family arsenosugar biosynthesis glycosyltransferase [Desulfurivibrio sp.]|nr:TIGR04283 family arsenosugar biosynthesis glycosyltransferase [Desulfurivibrio sp.]